MKNRAGRPGKHPGRSPETSGYAAVIADLVASRRFDPRDRALLQEELQAFLLTVNEGFADCLAAKFVITTGDEFQGLLRDPTVLPDLFWDARVQLPRAAVRFGIGYGTIYTPLQAEAIGMDGPAFHAAREAILIAKRDGWRGGVFQGFRDQDPVLNGIAHLLERLAAIMSPRQRQLADLLRSGLDQTEVARQLGISRQAVSKQARSLGWKSYRAGEEGLRAALVEFSDSLEAG